MIGVGPFSIQVVLAGVSVLLAWFVARRVARLFPGASHKAAGAALMDGVFWGFVGARLGFIALWWKEYAERPISMVAIGDGGFAWWLGLPVAAVVVWWRTRSAKVLRRPAAAGVAAGVAVWFLANSVLGLTLRTAEPLPDLHLATLDQHPVSLASYTGRPVVLNLWATWCPPCRREMPVFERAQAEFTNIVFVMVNQGESGQQARAFLENEGLSLSDVLLDPGSTVMQAVGSKGLPTTLFYDAQGRLVDTHLGEMTMPGLKSKITRRFGQSAKPLAADK